MKVKEITIGTIVGLMSIVGGTFAAVNYFQPREVAQVEHAEISEYSERSKLEAELNLAVLEIGYLLDMPQRSAQEENRLQYLNARRIVIESRLDELTGA